jgi:hypothetical protein
MISFRDWCVLSCVLSNPLEDLVLTILIQGNVLSSLSGLVQPVREGRLDMGSLAVECPPQRIDRDWDVVTRFCTDLHECNLLASTFKSSILWVLYQNLPAWPERQNCSRHDKMTSRGSAGAAAVSPEIFWFSM